MPPAPAPEPRKRTAIPVARIAKRAHQYDNTEAKQKEFYAASKKHRAYQRLLKREGLATTKPSQQTDSSTQSNTANSAEASTSSATKSPFQLKEHDEEFPELQFPGANRKRKIEAKREAKQREVEEQEQVKKQKLEEKAVNKAARKQRVKRFATKTRTGQPIMANMLANLMDQYNRTKANGSRTAAAHTT